jgi:hypothetical protein
LAGRLDGIETLRFQRRQPKVNANTRKSIGQLIKLLHALDCRVDLVVRDGKAA